MSTPKSNAAASSSNGRPKASDNASMHSILAAAVGLSNLQSEGDSPTPPTTHANNLSSKHPPKPTMPEAALNQAMPNNNYSAAVAVERSYLMGLGAAHNITPSASSSVLPSQYGMQQYGMAALGSYHGSSFAPTGFAQSFLGGNHPSAAIHSASLAAAEQRLAFADRMAASLGPADAGYPYYAQQYLSMQAAMQMQPPYSMQPPQQSFQQRMTSPGAIPDSKNFPETLFDIINNQEHAHIISWLPHGKAFIIHDKERFASIILRRYFDGAKFTSLTRRLKRWNFVRVPRGPEMGAYYNPYFVRDQPELVQNLRYKSESQADEVKKKQGRKGDDEKTEKTEKTEEVDETQKDDLPKTEGNEEKEFQGKKAESPSFDSEKKTEEKQSPKALKGGGSKPPHSDLPLPSELRKRTETLKLEAAAIASTPHPHLFSNGRPHDTSMSEIERELLYARFKLSQEAAVGSQPGLPENMPSSLLPLSQNQPYDPRAAASATTQRMLEIEHAQRILEAERVLGLSHGSTGMAPNLSPREEMIASATHTGMQARLNPPLVPQKALRLDEEGSAKLPQDGKGSSTSPASGRRLVMLSQKEEVEFAEYLFIKRNT